MVEAPPDRGSKPATAARIYDYILGGTFNFLADRQAGDKMIEMFPMVRAAARDNRSFLRRAARHVANAGVTQFLDIGSGIPTEGNVHEVVQAVTPDARVVYVDIDPVAVSESLDLLRNNPHATAINADLREPGSILEHQQVRATLDFDRPVGLLLCAVLHFVPDDELATGVVRTLLKALPPGSHLVLSHGSVEGMPERTAQLEDAKDLYKRNTSSQLFPRTRGEVLGFFEGLDLVDPGVVWVPQWHPDPADPSNFEDNPPQSASVGGVGRVV
ncbi:S-adenosyl methyltransferase [Asanoa hainanensis]|uniref:S-adenosyl methyltransferase n=1 Tax=Asanoa hainanensis TaxID=560556 RepID=A0A239MGP8_9ACTN|nr:SAM-dependent methyltransferase [Asanoa hainanensis]SNT41292.1 S-adenosyl methyltransferase [Asanoa hainanensis]